MLIIPKCDATPVGKSVGETKKRRRDSFMSTNSQIVLFVGVAFSVGACTHEVVEQTLPPSTTVERHTTTTIGQPVEPQSSSTTTVVRPAQ
jgi:hypothetical protein